MLAVVVVRRFLHYPHTVTGTCVCVCIYIYIYIYIYICACIYVGEAWGDPGGEWMGLSQGIGKVETALSACTVHRS